MAKPGLTLTLSATTTSATTQSVATGITVNANTARWVRCIAIARSTDDQDYTIMCIFIRAFRAGGAASLGTRQTVVNDESAAGFDVDFSLNGNDIEIDVTGLAKDVNWELMVDTQEAA